MMANAPTARRHVCVQRAKVTPHGMGVRPATVSTALNASRPEKVFTTFTCAPVMRSVKISNNEEKERDFSAPLLLIIFRFLRWP